MIAYGLGGGVLLGFERRVTRREANLDYLKKKVGR